MPQSHYEGTVYFLPLGPQEFLVFISSTSEGWKALSWPWSHQAVLMPVQLNWESSDLTTRPTSNLNTPKILLKSYLSNVYLQFSCYWIFQKESSICIYIFIIVGCHSLFDRLLHWIFLLRSRYSGYFSFTMLLTWFHFTFRRWRKGKLKIKHTKEASTEIWTRSECSFDSEKSSLKDRCRISLQHKQSQVN